MISIQLLPNWLKASAGVDLAQLTAKIRPVIRTKLSYPVPRYIVERWALRHGWFVDFDTDNFLAISGSPDLSRWILSIDREIVEHTYRLGLALGYPSCCCRSAARVGESNLDAWAQVLCRQQFIGRFKAIDPSRYHEGHALISHIPCSTRCQASLKMALMLAKVLKYHNTCTCWRQ